MFQRMWSLFGESKRSIYCLIIFCVFHTHICPQSPQKTFVWTQFDVFCKSSNALFFYHITAKYKFIFSLRPIIHFKYMLSDISIVKEILN